MKSSHWFLESIAADGSRLKYDIVDLPFRIGRGQENDLVLTTPGLSRKHAMFDDDISTQLRLTDLNSTNGTFVNRQRIDGSCLLRENDIIHFFTAEFRLGRHQPDQSRFISSNDSRTLLMPMGTNLSLIHI